MVAQIEKMLDQHVRPQLGAHGGDIEVVALKDGILEVKLLGPCAGCPAAELTGESLVEQQLLIHAEGIVKVILQRSANEELLSQARSMLGRRSRLCGSV